MSAAHRVNEVPGSFQELLASKTVGVLGTIGPSGAPQVSPLWFHWDGALIRFQVAADYQKFRNLQRDARAALTVIDPANQERYIEFRGTVTISRELDEELIRQLARKYLGTDTFPWESSPDTPNITLTPERIITLG